MRGYTHLAAGIAAAALVPGLSLATGAGIIVGSILPDVDKSTSLIGRRVPFLPRLLKHRGVTHSLLVAGLLYPLNPGLCLGCGIHLVLDMMNPEGVPLLWPIPISFRVPLLNRFMPSGKFWDKVLGGFLWVLDTVLIAMVVLGLNLQPPFLGAG